MAKPRRIADIEAIVSAPSAAPVQSVDKGALGLATRSQAPCLAARVGRAARQAAPRRRPISLGSTLMVARISPTAAFPSPARWPTLSQRRRAARPSPHLDDA